MSLAGVELMYKLIFFVPATHLEAVKSAVFKLGAGKSKKYGACCWETLGTLQYIPLENSHPEVGAKGELCATPEYKVEVLCENADLENIIEGMIKAHPYEEPAFEIHPFRTSLKDFT